MKTSPAGVIIALALACNVSCQETKRVPEPTLPDITKATDVFSLALTIDDPVLRNALAKHAETAERLLEAPVEHVQGVVVASGPTGSEVSATGDWKFHVSLQPWSRAGAELNGRRLTLNRVVSKALYEELKAYFLPHRIVEVTVRIDPVALGDANADWLHSALVGVVEPVAVSEQLVAIQKRSMTPFEITDSFFGVLRLERQWDWFSGKRRGPDGDYDLSIECHLYEEADLPRARALIESLEITLPEIKRIVALALIETHETTWDTEEPLTVDLVVHRSKLSLAHVHRNGSIDVYFDDGQLFLGHVISIRVDPDGSVTTYGIEG